MFGAIEILIKEYIECPRVDIMNRIINMLKIIRIMNRTSDKFTEIDKLEKIMFKKMMIIYKIYKTDSCDDKLMKGLLTYNIIESRNLSYLLKN